MSEQKFLEEDSFLNPPAIYRGMPFWAWNGKLDSDKLCSQIDNFRKMGFGGFYMHSRIGLADEYLGEIFMQCIRDCCDYAAKAGMVACLYDEDKWPSGFGGGRVTEDDRLAQRYLLFSSKRYEDGDYRREKHTSGRLTEDGKISMVAAYSVALDAEKLVSYKRVDLKCDEADYFAYIVVTKALSWFNNRPYADILNPKAVDAFIECTHERYKEALGDRLNKGIWRIFTDEPQFSRVENLSSIVGEAGIPWTERFDEAYHERYGKKLVDSLPELFFERADDEPAVVRYNYMNLLAEWFADVFLQRIGDWCAANGFQATGHLMEEDTLLGQTKCSGEAMRAYRGLQLPGVDILADRCHHNTLKQAQSVAHQYDREGVLCESYGVTNWDFDFRGHKRQGDWLAALGVTARVPHLAWVKMGGESKRDYPAALDFRSPWYTQYGIIEDHLARVSLAMSKGRPVVRLGVLHPIESYWMLYGPEDQTALARSEMERRFSELTEWLLSGLMDFDFISEALLSDIGSVECTCIKVGAMTYDAVIVPPLITIRSTTLSLLKRFMTQGGRVIFLGDLPKCVDGVRSSAAMAVAETGICLGFERDRLLTALEDLREIDVRQANGLRVDELVYQIREVGEERYLFLAHGAPKAAGTKINGVSLRLTLMGLWRITICDTENGSMRSIPFFQRNGHTYCDFTLNEHDSLLLKLIKGNGYEKMPQVGTTLEMQIPVPIECRAKLDEDNVLLLDRAQWQLDGGEWHEAEDILRIDNAVRDQLGMFKRTEAFPQPWLTGDQKQETHSLLLKYTISAQTDVDKVDLALEDLERAEVCFNGKPINPTEYDHYLDDTIYRIRLGCLNRGENILQVRYKFDTNTNLESMYLLGDFGVSVCGYKAVVTPPVQTIAFGPAERQGLAFYGGSLKYCFAVDIPEAGEAVLKVADYDAPLLSVKVDDGDEKCFYAWPYEAELGTLSAGKHEIVLTAYGNRYNTFGQLHNCNPNESYFDPNTWRTKGVFWSEAYRLKPFGVTYPPVLLMRKNKD